MPWDDGLTGTAREIAATTESPLRVMAGPGTGKSFALMRRIARLLEEGVDPRRILAVTFTRTAAAALVRDLNALGIGGCGEIQAVTLHSFCFRLLSRQEVFAFLGRVARPIVTFRKSGVLQYEGKTLLEDLCGNPDFGTKRDCTRRLLAFEAAWARLQSEEAGWPNDPADQTFQEALLNWLVFHRAMLLGELVPVALRYLRTNPACEALTAFDHIMVDEYQDLNRAEQDLIDLLAQHGTLTVVGDVDQSIYRFRHANPEGIQAFAFTHGHTHDETLDLCRRCPTRVVQMADHLIRRNHPAAPEQRLFPRPENPAGRIHRLQWQTPDQEAQGLADFMRHLIDQHGYNAGEILVLTPRRLFGYAIRDRLAEAGVPVHSFYHEEALEDIEAQRAFTVLRLLADREDKVALRWWLGDGSDTGRQNAYRTLQERCEVTGESPWVVLTALANGTLELNRTGPLTQKFRQLGEILETCQQVELPVIVDRLFPQGSENIRILREMALAAIGGCGDVTDLLRSLLGSITNPEIPQQVDYVRVMSLHKSKGLTSRAVIVAGCIQGIVPTQDEHATPLDQRAILAEQRRLFYVAITRGTEILVLSSVLTLERQIAHRIGATVRNTGGAMAPAITSQFFDELGPHAPAAEIGSTWLNNGFGF